jgi:hypothetical protein
VEIKTYARFPETVFLGEKLSAWSWIVCCYQTLGLELLSEYLLNLTEDEIREKQDKGKTWKEGVMEALNRILETESTRG